MLTRKKILLILIMLAVIFTVGVTGYMLLLHISFVDALYMTVILI